MGDMDEGEDVSQDPDWEPGVFQIMFASMGQGDCCVITCPDGAHIMIDCGCTTMETEGLGHVKDMIRSSKYIGRGELHANRLYALILTHPDEDHINQVEYIVAGKKDALKIDSVYFSDSIERENFKKSPLYHYSSGGCNKALYNYSKVDAMYCVTLRDGEHELHRWKKPFNEEKYSTANHLIEEGRVCVKGGTFYDEHDNRLDWEVSIIAGNVLRNEANDHSDTNGRNAASLVTLVTNGDEKVLICGDATRSTQDYLVKAYAKSDLIKNLTLLQVPHHGSAFTASTTAFVNLLKPKMLVISSKAQEYRFHHPGESVIDDYMEHTDEVEKARPTQAWKSMDAKSFYALADKWVEDKKKGRIKYTENPGRTRYTRTDVTKDMTGEILLEGTNSYRSKYVLYQRQIKRDISQTGLHQHCTYYFP